MNDPTDRQAQADRQTHRPWNWLPIQANVHPHQIPLVVKTHKKLISHMAFKYHASTSDSHPHYHNGNISNHSQANLTHQDSHIYNGTHYHTHHNQPYLNIRLAGHMSNLNQWHAEHIWHHRLFTNLLWIQKIYPFQSKKTTERMKSWIRPREKMHPHSF